MKGDFFFKLWKIQVYQGRLFKNKFMEDTSMSNTHDRVMQVLVYVRKIHVRKETNLQE